MKACPTSAASDTARDEHPSAAPRVSVVLPTYNHLKLLPQAIDSVLAQTFADFELIIVNDGSTDGTREFLDSLEDPRVRVLHQANQKLPTALNNGFAAARGELLTWTSADNFCAPLFLEALVAALDANPDAALAIGAFAFTDADGRITRIHRPEDLSLPAFLPHNPGVAAFLYRRNCLETIGTYEPSLNGAEDWDMWVRIVERHPVVFVPEVLYYYREHADSMTAQIPGHVAAASRRVLERALERRGGALDLEELYPAILDCADREQAITHAALDFGTRLLHSHLAPPELAARFLSTAFERQPDAVTATNLMLAFARGGDHHSALRLAAHLEPVQEPTVQALVALVREEGDPDAPRLRHARAFELRRDQSELLQRHQARRRIFSFTAGQASAETVDQEAMLERTIREAIELRPDGIEAWQLLAAFEIKRKNWLPGARAARRAVELDDRNVKSLLLLAHCLLGGGDGETAKLVFERVLIIDPENQLARECLQDLSETPEPVSPAEPSETEELARAERNVREVLRLEPANLDALRLLARILSAQGRHTEVLGTANRVLATDSKDIETRALLAASHWQLGARTTAALLFEEVLAADPQNATALAWQAENEGSSVSTPTAATAPQPLAVQANDRPASFTEEIACPFCQSRDARRIRNAADIVECGSCQTVYLRTRMTQERMEELYQTYADDGSHMAVPRSLDEAGSSCLKRDYFLQEILKISDQRGRILDIGCGWGAFLLNARDQGFTPSGMELTRKAVRYANESLQIPVVNTQFLDTPYEPDSHQVITMLHVLEHLPHPREALAKVFRTLRPGGLFCGIVPNFASFCSQNARDQWYWLDPNYHYVHYTPATLRRHLEAAGFVVERIETALGDYGHPMHREVARRLNSRWENETEHEWFVKQLGENGQGEEIRFFARKPESVPVAHPDRALEDALLRERLEHLLDVREPVAMPVFTAARELVEAALAADDPVAFATANRDTLDRLFFGLLDLRIGNARREHRNDDARRLNALRDTLVANSDRKPRAREQGWSFCFITNGRRPEKLRRAIKSVQALKIPNFEILVGGEPPAGFDDVIQVPVPEGARLGRLGEMRNRLLDRARFDHLVVADDDVLFQPDFFTGLKKFGDDFEVLCVRFLNPDGTRYWDWATNGGPRGHTLLPYDQTDDHVYVTGGLCVMKAAVGDRVRWSDHLGFYQGEDADFSKRLHAAGISIRCNRHSTVVHDDPRNTELDDIIVDATAVRFRAWKHLVSGRETEARSLHRRVGSMDPGAPNSWPEFVLACALGKQEGRYIQFHPELLPPVSEAKSEKNHFARLAALLAQVIEQIGPFYFHCGGAGDALLLLSSFYDRHPDAVILSLPNSQPAMKSLFDAFPKLKRVYFLPEHPDPNHHLLIRMLMKLLKNCRGVGTTPYQEYSEWNAGFDIFKDRGIIEHPVWAKGFRRDDRPACVTLAPKGSLIGMVGSKRNQIDPASWPALIETIRKTGLQPVLLGTPAEAKDYPALEGCLDRRSFSFAEQMEWIASSRVFIGADSWGKTFAALAGVRTVVFDSLRGSDWTGRKDASDFVFIDPWKDITLVRSLAECEQALQRALQNLPAHKPVAATTPSRSDRLEINWLGSFLDYGSLSHINRVLTDELVIKHRATVRRVQTTPVAAGKLSKPLQSYRGKLASRPSEAASLTVRHAWPPDWSRPSHGKLAVIQPWEFGSLPMEWVKASVNVDAFWVPSNHVRQVYVESGVPAEKVHVVPNGIDPQVFRPEARPLKLATRKSLKFLFVGGTIHRKGPDVLLRAFCETFTAKDDVCLVIKDFGGGSVYAGQTLEQQIHELRRLPNAPEILYLNDELKPQDLPGLYTACDCLAHPYRGEGFGLPVLEAMACGLPVMVTAGGATDDFVPAGTGYHIPSVRKVFGREISGLQLVGDGWLLEPDLNATKTLLRHVFTHRDEARDKGLTAAAHARQHWTWQHTAARLHELAQTLVNGVPATPLTPVATQDTNATASQPGQSAHPSPSTSPASSPRKQPRIELPPVATLGHLGTARDLFRQKQLVAAWNATLDALALRPFHPEAWLLLAEIARTSGDGRLLKECADRALALTPDWKPAKKFLKSHPIPKNGGKLNLAPVPARGPHRLTVCLIAKNEEKFLGRCLGSIQGIAEQIVVVDTGSTDRTVEIAKSHGAEVHHFTWCDDFSAARNAALEQATGDWVLVLDADEELAPDAAAQLRRALDARNIIGWRLPIVDAGHEDEGCTYVPRLFRNAPGLFYVSRVHEQVFSSVEVRRAEWGMETGIGEATLLHHGYTTEMVRDRNKVARNLRLLELAIEEIPGDANLLMNYGLELVRSGRLKDGLAQYTAAFNALCQTPVAEVTPELRETLVTHFSTHLMKAGMHAEILELLNHPVATRNGLSASLHFTLGLAYQELERWPEAAEQFRQCLARRAQKTFFLANKVIFGGAPRHCLALALWKSGNTGAAATEFSAALEEDPALLPLRMDHARFLEDQGEPIQALQQLHAIVTTDTSALAAWSAGGRIALSDPHFIEFARDWTAEAIKHHADQHVIVAQRAETLLVTQQYADALPLWRRLNGHPRALAARLLCELMQDEFSIDEPPANERETSQEFLNWYRRLVSYRAAEGVQAVAERLDLLRPLLPGAAHALDRVMEAAAIEAA